MKRVITGLLVMLLIGFLLLGALSGGANPALPTANQPLSVPTPQPAKAGSQLKKRLKKPAITAPSQPSLVPATFDDIQDAQAIDSQTWWDYAKETFNSALIAVGITGQETETSTELTETYWLSTCYKEAAGDQNSEAWKAFMVWINQPDGPSHPSFNVMRVVCRPQPMSGPNEFQVGSEDPAEP